MIYFVDKAFQNRWKSFQFLKFEEKKKRHIFSLKSTIISLNKEVPNDDIFVLSAKGFISKLTFVTEPQHQLNFVDIDFRFWWDLTV